jgi:hypothetical protein
MVVAIIGPAHAWAQPLLRLFDTVVGIGVGVACKWAASAVFSGFGARARNQGSIDKRRCIQALAPAIGEVAG